MNYFPLQMMPLNLLVKNGHCWFAICRWFLIWAFLPIDCVIRITCLDWLIAGTSDKGIFKKDYFPCKYIVTNFSVAHLRVSFNLLLFPPPPPVTPMRKIKPLDVFVTNVSLLYCIANGLIGNFFPVVNAKIFIRKNIYISVSVHVDSV